MPGRLPSPRWSRSWRSLAEGSVELKEGAEFFRLGARMHVVCNQPHAKSRCAARHGAADPPATENAERLAKDITPPHAAPDAMAHVDVADVHATGESKEQGEGEIRDRFVEQAGRVGDHDTRLSRSGHVDGIIADAPAGNNFEFGSSRGLENRGVKFVHACQGGIHPRQTLQQFIGGKRARYGRNDQIAAGIAQQL